MSKRIFALLLCAVMLLPCLAGCAEKDPDNPDIGPYITMYLTNEIYDLDPANVGYNKEAQNIANMLFETLFTLDEKGKIKNSLVKKVIIEEDEKEKEYSMTLELREAYWTNKSLVTSDDVVFTFKRLLNPNNSFSAASLLFDIKNARAVKEGDCSIDDLGVEASEQDVVKITFEGPIDYEQFKLNLTNVATAPLLESCVSRNADWAKKASTIVTNGPFKLGKISYTDVLNATGTDTIKIFDDYAIDRNGSAGGSRTPQKKLFYFYLERNAYYYRDVEHDAIDSSVTPYRLLVDCTKTDEQILEEFKNGEIFYVGDIPLSVRNDSFVKENVKISNALSTFVLSLNQNALIADGTEMGSKLFADANVREALSLVIDREAIAKAIVYAEAATALVGPGIFEGGKASDKDFRAVGGTLLETSANKDAALELLKDIKPSDYTFTIRVSDIDEINVKIAEMVAETWQRDLGFNVTVEKMETIQNNDYLAEIGEAPSDVCDDRMVDTLQRGNYAVAAFDYNAYSADAYSMLSNFAFSFSGMAMTNDPLNNIYETNGHLIGYNSEKFNAIMEAVYYVPYFANLTADNFGFLGIYDTKAEYQEVYNSVKSVYDTYGITPSTKAADWTKQKAKLLHEAEKVLIQEDYAIIPVVFNQNAELISDDLSKISSTYYSPSLFRKTKQKNHMDYVEGLKEFPAKKEETTAETTAASTPSTTN